MRNHRIGFRHALRGIGRAFTGSNLRIEFLVFILAVALAFYFDISFTEWILLILASSAVFSLECVNTSIEQWCDLVEPGYNETVRDIKDIAAGAVLIAAIASLIIGGIIFLPRISGHF